MSDFQLGYTFGILTPVLILGLIVGGVALYDYLWSLGDGK